MKYVILTFVFCLILAPSYAESSPFLTSDPADGNATSCQFESFQLPCVLDATRAIRVDLQALPVGSHSVRAQFCRGVWCSEWSLSFPFVRPVLRAPTGVLLQK